MVETAMARADGSSVKASPIGRHSNRNRNKLRHPPAAHWQNALPRPRRENDFRFEKTRDTKGEEKMKRARSN